MTVTIKPLHNVFVGEVDGIDLRRPLCAAEVAAIEAGMDQYGVLVLHDQNITDAQQAAFSRNFGALEMPDKVSNITKDEDRRLAPIMADISNLDRNNKLFDRDDRHRMFNLGNRLWHSDSSFRVVPSKYSLLSARIIPEHDGDTEFADMRAAYDALNDAAKTEIEDLVCEHSLLTSRGTLGFTELSNQERANFKPARQCLVRCHPVTGRKSIYLSAHAGGIVGWPVPEARIFLRDLTEDATRPQNVYRHVWRQYDLVIWDNRQVMHRARHFDDVNDVRDMRRTTVAGESQTAVQAA
jgi:alpha-ketoglutarate-dependent 2,4-dichlorophenoxyacetate dioxygenase